MSPTKGTPATLSLHSAPEVGCPAKSTPQLLLTLQGTHLGAGCYLLSLSSYLSFLGRKLGLGASSVSFSDVTSGIIPHHFIEIHGPLLEVSGRLFRILKEEGENKSQLLYLQCVRSFQTGPLSSD